MSSCADGVEWQLTQREQESFHYRRRLPLWATSNQPQGKLLAMLGTTQNSCGFHSLRKYTQPGGGQRVGDLSAVWRMKEYKEICGEDKQRGSVPDILITRPVHINNGGTCRTALHFQATLRASIYIYILYICWQKAHAGYRWLLLGVHLWMHKEFWTRRSSRCIGDKVFHLYIAVTSASAFNRKEYYHGNSTLHRPI